MAGFTSDDQLFSSRAVLRCTPSSTFDILFRATASLASILASFRYLLYLYLFYLRLVESIASYLTQTVLNSIRSLHYYIVYGLYGGGLAST